MSAPDTSALLADETFEGSGSGDRPTWGRPGGGNDGTRNDDDDEDADDDRDDTESSGSGMGPIEIGKPRSSEVGTHFYQTCVYRREKSSKTNYYLLPFQNTCHRAATRSSPRARPDRPARARRPS